MTEHELKTWPVYFAGVLDGTKTFELRKADRPFEVGDTLHLREWNPDTKGYTGRELRREVTYVLKVSELGLAENCVVMGLSSSWKDQCHDQAEQLVKLSDMLKKLEWSGDDTVRACNSCFGTQASGHTADCELNKLLEPYR